MRWSREEYIELMTYGKVERQMFVELFGPLVGLEKEWKMQGASQAEIDMYGCDWDYDQKFSFHCVAPRLSGDGYGQLAEDQTIL